MEEAGFFDALVLFSRNYTLSIPGANSCEKFKYHLYEIFIDDVSSVLLDFCAFF
jgi:hypothetical protein